MTSCMSTRAGSAIRRGWRLAAHRQLPIRSSNNPPGFSAASYLPAVLSQGAYGGKQYCLPDFVSTVVVAYRKDLFEAAGLEPPTTLDDVLAAAKALNGKNGMAGITLPGKATGATADVLGSLITAYGSWWYDKADKPALDKTAATKAIQFYVDAAKYAPQGILNFHFDEVATAAAQGEAAIAISTTPSLSWVEDPKRSKTVGKWAYVPLAAEAGKPSGELIFWNWCINANSNNRRRPIPSSNIGRAPRSKRRWRVRRARPEPPRISMRTRRSWRICPSCRRCERR